MKPLIRLIFTSVLLTTLIAPVRAVSPRDELLRLVPEDVGFCLVVQDLRQHYATLAEAPFFINLRNSPTGQKLANDPELTKFATVEKMLKEHLNIDFAQLREDILGDAIVFAYRPGPAGKPDQDQGVFLVRARDEARLAALAKRINETQLKFGDLKKVTEISSENGKYFERIERTQNKTYFALRGPVLVFSGQEELLKQVLERERRASPDAPPPALARQMDQLGAAKALFAVWVNPRVFEAELKQKLESAQGGEAAFLKTFVKNWQACEGAVFSIKVDQDLEMSWGLRGKPEALSPGLRKVLSETTQRSELWNSVPKDALYAAAMRVDMPALFAAWTEFLSDDVRKAIRDGTDQAAGPAVGKVLRDVPNSFGPDVGICVMPPADEKTWFPQIVWAARVRPGTGGKPVEQTLTDALGFFSGLAVLDYNSKHDDRLTLKTVQQDKLEVKYFSNEKVFPPGLEPAYAIKDNYLLLASSPEVIRRFKIGTAPANESAEVPLIYASLKSLRTYLKDRRELLISLIMEKDKLSKTDAAKQLDSAIEGLQHVDAIELTQRPSPGQVILTLRLKPALPLKK